MAISRSRFPAIGQAAGEEQPPRPYKYLCLCVLFLVYCLVCLAISFLKIFPFTFLTPGGELSIGFLFAENGVLLGSL